MTTYTFDEIAVRGTKRVPCSACGRKLDRTKKFWMTLNPWNTNPDGSLRSESDIRRALAEKVAVWQSEPARHAKCEPVR